MDRSRILSSRPFSLANRWIALTIAAGQLALAEPPGTVHPVATTLAGKVRGYVDSGINVFKGIPYGADTAKRRFQAPVPPEPWTGIRDTLAFAPGAPQPAAASPNPDWGVGYPSEDCLALNVWTPGLRDGRKRPVVVYLHGGGYSTLSGNTIDGVFLSQSRDVVVVAVTHRLNGFGYLYLGDLGGPKFADSGNAGQLDLILALRWVRDNIAEFGGDPGCVTIFGESGGAGKCAVLMAMPAARGLFQRVWTMSGAAVKANSRASATADARAVLQALGIPADRVEEIRNVPRDRLIAALGAVKDNWGPVVDGRNLPRDPFFPDASSVSADIPLVIGTTHDEMTSFMDRNPRFIDLTWDGLHEILQQIRPFATGPKAEAIMAEYRQLYPAYTPREVLFAATTAVTIWRDVVAESERRAEQGAPTFVYCLNWPGKGQAGHAIDKWLIANDPVGNWRTRDRPGAPEIAALMSDSFASFARTGNPNTPKLPLWPRFNLENRPTMLFDLPPQVSNDPRGEERKFFAIPAR